MLTLTKIYEEITKKKTKETSPKSENNWTPRRCETYILPSFRVPKSRAKAAQRKKFSMVLAFVRRVRNIRAAEGCTIMPIPTTNKSIQTSMRGFTMSTSIQENVPQVAQ